jgi:hypothetical protein
MKAFIYQDHQAHIGSHMAFMQDPQVAQMIGQNPQAQQIMASTTGTHRRALRVPVPSADRGEVGRNTPCTGAGDARRNRGSVVSVGGRCGSTTHSSKQQQAAQAAAQQQAQDPMFQLKQQELAIKQAEVQRKSQKDMADAQAKETEAERKAKKDLLDAMIEAERLKIDQQEVAIQAKTEGVKIRAQREQAQQQRNMDLMKMIGATKNNQNTPKKE